MREDLQEEDVARLRRIKLAERYLHHPETVLAPHSRPGSQRGASDAGSVADAGVEVTPPPSGRSRGRAGQRTLEASGSAPVLNPSSGTPVGSARSQLSRHSGGSREGRTPSLGSALRAAGSAAAGTASTGSLPVLSPESLGGIAATPATSSKRSSPRDIARDQLLSGWWSKTRCFNLMIGKDATQCRRQALGTTGGCLAFGNGRLPLFKGTHMLLSGYFYCFKIKAMDTTRLPVRGYSQGSALAVGISRISPAQPRLQGAMCPLYAYEVPGSVVVGYGSNVVEDGKWFKSPWDANVLQIGDKVGVLLTPDGDLVIFHNDVQALRVQTNLAAGAAAGTSTQALQKRCYYAMVDLSGHVSEVTMLPKAEPPNVPLLIKDTIERKLA